MSTLVSEPKFFSGNYYDGRTSASRRVELVVAQDGAISIYFAGIHEVTYARIDFSYSSPIGNGPTIINLPNQAQVELEHDSEFVTLLSKTAPDQFAIVRKIEQRPSLALVFVTLSMALVIGVYLLGVPALSAILQPLIPYPWKKSLGQQIVFALDSSILEPTKISELQMQAMRSTLSELGNQVPGGKNINLLARRYLAGKDAGELEIANAFAVLPETVIVTDELVKLLNAAQLEAVIAHELGHLALDHGTNGILKTVISSTLAIFTFGSDPGIIQSVALSLMESRYSQEQETAADLYAVTLLNRLGKDSNALASALEILSRGDPESEILNSKIFQYASSHPSTPERVELIRKNSR